MGKKSEKRQHVTSVIGWLLWLLLCCIPMLGPIITAFAPKDPAARNFGALLVVLHLLTLIAVIASFIIYGDAFLDYIFYLLDLLSPPAA